MSWRIFSLILFVAIILALFATYYFAPGVWWKIIQFSPGSPFVNPP